MNFQEDALISRDMMRQMCLSFLKKDSWLWIELKSIKMFFFWEYLQAVQDPLINLNVIRYICFHLAPLYKMKEL